MVLDPTISFRAVPLRSGSGVVGGSTRAVTGVPTPRGLPKVVMDVGSEVWVRVPGEQAWEAGKITEVRPLTAPQPLRATFRRAEGHFTLMLLMMWRRAFSV